MNSDVIAKSILDEIEDVVYISDPKTYDLYYINGSLHKALGCPPEAAWRRKKCYKVLQGMDSPCPFCTNHLLKEAEFYNWKHHNEHLDEYFYIQDKLVNFEGIQARLEIAKNVTTQTLLEQDLIAQLSEQKTLNDCISYLHTDLSPDACINHLLRLVAEYYKAERGYIFLLKDEDTVLNNTHEWCGHGVEPQIQNLQGVPATVVDSWFHKYNEVGEFYIDALTEDVNPDSVEYKMLAEQNIHSLVTAPLQNTDGSYMGFLGVDNPKENGKRTMVIRAAAKFVADFMDKNKQLDTLYQISYFDNLTGMGNRHSYSLRIQNLQNNPPETLGVVYVDINGLKAVNDKFGHKAGDDYIGELGTFLLNLYGDCSYRIGGDEFVMVCAEKEEWCFKNKLGKLQTFANKGDFPIAAIGYCWREGNCNVIEQIETADRLMYQDKEKQYNEFGGKSDLFRRKFLLDASHHDPNPGKEWLLFTELWKRNCGQEPC